jgi:pimeloyl-ACP methyl ester carboxylesterase
VRRIAGWLVGFALIAGQAAGVRADSAAPVTDIGMHEGVAYRIDVPHDWNHELVVFFHGYALEPIKFPPLEPVSPMFTPLLERGYAVLQSAYAATGWAVEQASADTERLREHFIAKYGKPKQTLALGMSMGGTLTVLALESKPEVYAAGLSLCGAVEPSDRMFQRDFALRAAFDCYFPDLLGPLVPVPSDYVPDAQVEAKIARALAGKPAAAQALLGFYGAADAKQLPLVIAFNTYETKDMQQHAHGNPFDNSELVYTGSGDDTALNDGVHRYRADPHARAYLARWYTPSGKLKRPLLELHDSGDPLVPAATGFEYAMIVQRAGYGDNFVQQYVNRTGHCAFTQQEIARAFGELIEWTRSGKRPVSGKLD